jgi:hypothetical protein
MLPVLNHPEQPPSNSNGVAIQDCDFTTLHLNPYAPQHIWTESYTNYYFHCWNVYDDTARAFPGGNQNLRVFVVDKKGNCWTSINGIARRRNFANETKVVGRNLSNNMPSAYVYTHSYDSAFTTNRGMGNIELYDFVNDTVIPIADLPGSNISNSAFRAITISRDDRKLYVLGHSGNIYELTIATRQYVNLGSISSNLAGSYAFSSGTMDTLGNWYICTWGRSRAYWVQVNLGKSAVYPLPIPDTIPGKVEAAPAVVSARAPLAVFPNPVRSAAGIHLAPAVFNGKDVSISILDQRGRVVQRFAVRPESNRDFSAAWQAERFPTGVYLIRAEASGRSWSKTVVVIR